jgi:hypothetical protein
VGGVEASFVVNHLSPYLLTELLLPTLTAGAPSRIVNVTSGAVTAAKRVFDTDPGGAATALTGQSGVVIGARRARWPKSVHALVFTLFAWSSAVASGAWGCRG